MASSAEKHLVVTGTVADGDKRARELGFPTANVYDAAAAADGVYAGLVKVEHDPAEWHVAVISVGRRATYYGAAGVRVLEAHLLDWSGNLYGKHISVALCAYLRPQRKFDSSVALIEQIQSDVAEVRRWAADNGMTGSELRGGGVPSGRWAFDPTPGRPRSDKMLRRSHRRAAALQRALAETSPSSVSHQDIARRADVPVGYLRWLHPDASSLASAVAAARAAVGRAGLQAAPRRADAEG